MSTLSHGYSYTPTYRYWQSMKSRCQNPNHQCFYAFGARGTKVCERWQTFEPFLEEMGERPEDTILALIDHDGDFEPGNVVWATREDVLYLRREQRKECKERKPDPKREVDEWFARLYA